MVSFVHSDGCVICARFLGRLGKKKRPRENTLEVLLFLAPLPGDIGLPHHDTHGLPDVGTDKG